MRTTKLGWMVVIALAVWSSIAHAKALTIEEQLARMNTELKLTEPQKPKVEVVVRDYYKKLAAVAKEDKRTRGRELRDERDEKLKGILTAEQYAKWEELRDEMFKKEKGPGK